MREFPFTFKEGFVKGLRRFLANPINSEALVELHNLAPMVGGLEPHQVITSLDADSITWGGIGAKDAVSGTSDITIAIIDYVDEDDIEGASVYIDDVLVGVTDANGELDVTGVAVGGHSLKVTKTGYVDSDADDLLNDYFVVS